MRENMDQKNSEYGHLLPSACPVQPCKKLNPLMHDAPKWPDLVQDLLRCDCLDTLCINRLTVIVGTILISKKSLREKCPYLEFFWLE